MQAVKPGKVGLKAIQIAVRRKATPVRDQAPKAGVTQGQATVHLQ